LNWNSDYVLTVTRDEKNADLDGWVTVVNNSGTAFHNARLQLVAGELNRIQTNARRDANMAYEMAAKAAAAPQFQQENFSEYHLYSLGRRTSVEDKETKQISLLQGSSVPVKKSSSSTDKTTTTTTRKSRLAAERSRHGLLQIQE